MADPRIDKLARLMVEYSAPVRAGDKVVIQGAPIAQPLLLAMYREVLLHGGHPLLMPSLPGAQEIFFRFASDLQLDYVLPVQKMVIMKSSFTAQACWMTRTLWRAGASLAPSSKSW